LIRWFHHTKRVAFLVVSQGAFLKRFFLAPALSSFINTVTHARVDLYIPQMGNQESVSSVDSPPAPAALLSTLSPLHQAQLKRWQQWQSLDTAALLRNDQESARVSELDLRNPGHASHHGKSQEFFSFRFINV
jgi:hypothetical protein